jgi:subtilisin family serine protease
MFSSFKSMPKISEELMFKKYAFSILLILALVFAGGFSRAQADDGVTPLEPEVVIPSADSGEMVAEGSNLWFVELSGTPLADGGSATTLKAEKAAFRAAASKAKIQYKERFAFSNLWNGFSVEAGSSQLSKLASMPGVKNIYPVGIVSIPETQFTAEPELYTALAQTGADIAQNELGYTGAGVKVAVMDTGIDYNHPDLGGCFGPGCRVVTGWDLVGDAYNADPSSLAYNPTPAPDAYPDDCNGHGTHVSGIIGANGTVKGVAPGVTFGAYRVFGCAGSTTEDIMIAAMERVLADDMDVLNMSIGSAYQWPQYPTAQAANRLVNKGVVVVASIGNNGTNGLYSAGAPGLGQKVIGVASYDNTYVTLNTFTVTPAGLTIGYANAAGSPLAPTSGSLPLAKTGTPTTANDGCSALPAGSLTGKAVLIRRGTCTFYAKAFNAMQAGASAVVLYNNSAGRFSPTVAGSPAITIPVVAVSDAEGVAINNAIDSGAQTLNWQSGTGSFTNPTGNLISSFSSYGLSPDLTLKPDIGAPGGLIYSTYPLEAGGYATISGTSMASPHVAGGVALLLEAKPNTPSQAVRGILQNSADPKNWFGNPGLGFLDNVHRQGAGMLDIPGAILSTTKIEPAKISAGEGEAGPFTQTLTVENNGAAAVTYDLTYVNALSTSGVITPGFTTSNATVSFSASSVTVPAGGSASVTATIVPATAPVNGQYGGYIVFTPQTPGQIYRVPYAGFVGDYQGIVAMTNASFPTGPLLGKLNSCTPVALLRGLDCFGTGSYGVYPAGNTYNLTDAYNTPYFLIHLEHQVRVLRMEVFDAVSGKAWHRIINEEYVGRSSASNTFFAYAWNGTTFSGNKTYTVPDGQYVVKISVLKANGDASNPAHWETWMSPVITLDRP